MNSDLPRRGSWNEPRNPLMLGARGRENPFSVLLVLARRQRVGRRSRSFLSHGGLAARRTACSGRAYSTTSQTPALKASCLTLVVIGGEKPGEGGSHCSLPAWSQGADIGLGGGRRRQRQRRQQKTRQRNQRQRKRQRKRHPWRLRGHGWS